MYTYARTDDSTHPYATNRGGYIFRTEVEAQAFCDAWNAYFQAMEPLEGLRALSREEYEYSCELLGVEPFSDAHIRNNAYGLRYGEITPWLTADENGLRTKAAGYTPAQAVQAELSKKRLEAMEAEYKPQSKPPTTYQRTLECGHTIHHPGHAMSASLGVVCPDCYDDWSG